MAQTLSPDRRAGVLWKRVVFFSLALFLLTSPAHAQQAMIVFGCFNKEQAEVLAGEMTVSNVASLDPRWPSCQGLRMAIGDMEDAKPILGPLSDWEGDPFALYAHKSNGEDMYFIVYWLNGYRPAGMSI